MNKEYLNSLSLKDLKTLAKEKKIHKFGKYYREELIEILLVEFKLTQTTQSQQHDQKD